MEEMLNIIEQCVERVERVKAQWPARLPGRYACNSATLTRLGNCLPRARFGYESFAGVEISIDEYVPDGEFRPVREKK